MTKSTIIREESIQAVFDLKVGYTLGLADIEILKRVASMALAAMDSEPVAWVMLEDLADKDIVSTPAYPDINDAMEMTHGELEPLYRHAQPAKTVQPVMFIDGDISSEDADKLAKVIRELHEKDERPLAKMARIIRENPHLTNECDMTKAQPAQVAPEEMTPQQASRSYGGEVRGYRAGWNACRAAMLQASPVCTCPSGDGSLRWPCPVHPGNSPAIPDGYVMVPKEPTKEMIDAGWLYFMGTKNPSSKGAYKAMLAAAPQEVPDGQR